MVMRVIEWSNGKKAVLPHQQIKPLKPHYVGSKKHCIETNKLSYCNLKRKEEYLRYTEITMSCFLVIVIKLCIKCIHKHSADSTDCLLEIIHKDKRGSLDYVED